MRKVHNETSRLRLLGAAELAVYENHGSSVEGAKVL